MELAKSGDNLAFEQIYELYLTPVYRYIYLRVSSIDLAEDLCQTVFLKAFAGLKNFEVTEREPLGYFFTIARNTIIDNSRKKNFLLAEDDFFDEVVDSKALPEQEFIDAEVRSYILEAVDRLDGDQRDVIIFKFLQEMDAKEIAKIMGKNPETVRQIQSRAIKKLRRIFEDKYVK